MNKIKIVYSKSDRPDKTPENAWRDHNVNKITLPKTEQVPTGDNFYTVEIELFDNEITKKFLKIIDSIKNDEINNIFIDHNEYSFITRERLIELQKYMNLLINEVNSPDGFPEFPVSEDFIINVIDETQKIRIEDIQVDKLNALHEWFEDVIKDPVLKTLDQTRHDRIHEICEHVNQLVHIMEGSFGEIKKQIRGEKRFFQVCRISNFWAELAEYPLTDEDYSNFKIEVPGNVYLDFATVGKNLWHAMETNDQELVLNGKVSPQLYIKPYFNYSISNIPVYPGTEEKLTERMEKWITENNLSQYIDHTLPVHAMGQALIGRVMYKGEPMSPDRSDEDISEMIQSLKEHKYLHGIYFE